MGIDSFVNSILDSYGVPGSLVIFVGIFIYVLKLSGSYFFGCLDSTDCPRWRAQLEASNGWRDAYNKGLQRGLDRLDNWLKPTYDDANRPDLSKSSFWQAAPWFWSARAFGVHLTIAVIYPLVLLILFWGFGNVNTSGIDDLLPENLSAGRRYTLLTLVFFFIFSLTQASIQSSWKRFVWMFVTVTFAVTSIVTYAGTGVVAVVGVFTVAAAGSGIVTFAGTGVVAVVGVFIVAVAVAVGVSYAVADTVVGDVAIIGVLTVSGAVVSFVLLILKTGERKSKLWLFLVGICLVAFLSAGYSFGYATVTRNEATLSFLVFMVTIPVVNAVFDYLSLGLTRYLLQKSLATGRNLIWYAGADFVAACLMLLVLSLTIIAVLSGLNLIAAGHGAHPIDIGGILSRMRRTPLDVSLWWIYIMIFSTFLPTFAHAALALGNAPLMRIFKKWRSRVIAGLKEIDAGGDSHHAKTSGALYLTVQLGWTLLMTVFAIGLLGAVLYWFLPGVGRTILFLSEWLAEALGEDISPGRILPFF